MLASSELNRIRRKCDKTLVNPKIIFFSLDSASGMYCDPEYNEIYDDDGKYHDMTNGIIIVNPKHIHEYEHIVVHEYRHHWQKFNMKNYDGISLPENYSEKENYNQIILDFFTKSKSELDALRFEVKYSNCYGEWIEPLYSLISDLLPKKFISLCQ